MHVQQRACGFPEGSFRAIMTMTWHSEMTEGLQLDCFPIWRLPWGISFISDMVIFLVRQVELPLMISQYWLKIVFSSASISFSLWSEADVQVGQKRFSKPIIIFRFSVSWKTYFFLLFSYFHAEGCLSLVLLFYIFFFSSNKLSMYFFVSIWSQKASWYTAILTVIFVLLDSWFHK